MENKKNILYLRLLKALYGCVKVALLWYELLSTTLKDMGFVFNPYDECVANKMVNGKQCTITWHVDDNKISHVDSKVMSQVIKDIKKKFGEMTVTRGKEHVFLRMDITFRGNGTFAILMKEYLEELIIEFGEEIGNGVTTSPAGKYMFSVDENSPKLDEERAKKFHSITAKLLYLSNRARVYLKLAVDFFTTRVTKRTVQDWNKLKRTL